MNKKLYFLGKMFQYHGFFEFKDRSDEPFKKLFCRFSLSSIFNFMQEHDELVCVCEYPSKKPIAFFSEKEIDEKRTVTQNVFYDTYETPREKFIFKICCFPKEKLIENQYIKPNYLMKEWIEWTEKHE